MVSNAFHMFAGSSSTSKHYLGVLPGGQICQIPGMLAKDPYQPPLQGPQADCAVM